MKAIASVITAITIAINAGIIYPSTMIVTEVDRDLDEVSMVTSTGHEFRMSGAEDWDEEDMVSAIMFSNFTANVDDDIVLKALFSRF